MIAFKDVPVCTPQGIKRQNLVFSDKIISIGEDLADAEVFNLPPNATVLPAFIDEHVHGAGGADAMDASAAALEKISATLAKEGTAYFLATTMTESRRKILNALSAIKEFKGGSGACLLGAHLEGPFISARFRGAQREEFIEKPDVNLFKEFYSESGGKIKVVTLAPEMDGAEELIKYLSELGVTASLGHSAATEAQVLRAVSLGASCITHTFNGQSPFTHREIGVAGSALSYGVYTEVIADLIHVCPSALKLLLKCKNVSEIILITDAMRAKGLGDGISELGGQKVKVKGGEARLEDGTLAGSVLTMNKAVKNTVEKLGVPLEEAVKFASINPAKNLKIDNITGSLEKGKSADFAIIDDNFNVLYTFRNGKIIYGGK